MPAQANAAPSGAPLVLDGKRIDEGIGALVNSRLEVRLDGQFRRFRASAGVVDMPVLGAPPAALTWRVLGDGKLLFQRKAGAAATAIDVPLEKVRTLELVAYAASDAPAVIAWGNAELVR